MTEEEIRVAKALAECTFLPGSWDKRFAKAIATIATQRPGEDLSPAQRDQMYRLARKYRRQMPSEVPA